MHLAALPEQRGIRVHGAHTARGRAARSGSIYVRQATPISAMALHRPAAATADHHQADYYLRMFAESYRLVEERIERYQREIARYEAAGDIDQARSCRRKMRAEQRERQGLKGLIGNLRRRFAVSALDDVALNSRRAWSGVR